MASVGKPVSALFAAFRVFLAFLVLLGWFGVEALGFLPTLTATIHNLHRGGNGSFTATTAGTLTTINASANAFTVFIKLHEASPRRSIHDLRAFDVLEQLPNQALRHF